MDEERGVHGPRHAGRSLKIVGVGWMAVWAVAMLGRDRAAMAVSASLKRTTEQRASSAPRRRRMVLVRSPQSRSVLGGTCTPAAAASTHVLADRSFFT